MEFLRSGNCYVLDVSARGCRFEDSIVEHINLGTMVITKLQPDGSLNYNPLFPFLSEPYFSISLSSCIFPSSLYFLLHCNALHIKILEEMVLMKNGLEIGVYI